MKNLLFVIASAVALIFVSSGTATAGSCTASLTGLPADTVCVGIVGAPPSSCTCSGNANGKFSGSATLTFDDKGCTAADFTGCTISVRCSSPAPRSCGLSGRPVGRLRGCNLDLDFSSCL